MQNLEMVCPNLKELEGVAPEQFLENRAFIQRNNQSGQPVWTSLRSSRFRFLQAKRVKRARAFGKKEQKK